MVSGPPGAGMADVTDDVEDHNTGVESVTIHHQQTVGQTAQDQNNNRGAVIHTVAVVT